MVAVVELLSFCVYGGGGGLFLVGIRLGFWDR